MSSFFFQLTISLWVVHFSYNFCSSFIFVHLSSSTQPESVGSNPALNHKFFNEFFGIVRPKKYFFFEKKSIFFWKNFFFPNFSNSCSLNIFEPKIWRRLGTFPSCLVNTKDIIDTTCSPQTVHQSELVGDCVRVERDLAVGNLNWTALVSRLSPVGYHLV